MPSVAAVKGKMNGSLRSPPLTAPPYGMSKHLRGKGFRNSHVYFSLTQHFYSSQVQRIQPGLIRSFPIAVPARMRSLVVILHQPIIQVFLQLFDAIIDLLAESYSIEFILDSFVETLTDAVGLRASGFSLRMIYILNG